MSTPLKSLAVAALVSLVSCGVEGGPAPVATNPVPTTYMRTVDVRIAPVVEAAAQRIGVDLHALIDRALQTIERHIDIAAPEITVEPGAVVIPQTGMNGRTDPDDGAVHLLIGLRNPALRQTFERWLPSSLAHELHHSKRLLQGPGFDPELGSRMIFEGLGSAFQLELFPDDVPPWTRAITPAQELDAWTKAEPLLGAELSNTAAGEWFFGTGDVPLWTGYTMGFRIVQSYLKRHPGTTAAALAVVDWRTILRESGYAGRPE